MAKNSFVLKNMDRILDCLTRGLDLNILTQGWGMESRGVVVSYQAQAPYLPRCCLPIHPACIRYGCL